jgi:Methyltransferase domain
VTACRPRPDSLETLRADAIKRARAWKHQLGTVLGRPRRGDIFDLVAPAGVGAEIGVFRGEFTPQIIKLAKPRELHLIDGWWTIYGERFPDWGPYTDYGQLTTERAWKDAQESIRAAGAEEIARFHIGNDVEILARFPDGYFDWVYLDTSHQYDHTRRELQALSPRIAAGGMILGDDWHDDPNHEHGGVAVAAKEFVAGGEWELVRVDRINRQWGMRRIPPRGRTAL